MKTDDLSRQARDKRKDNSHKKRVMMSMLYRASTSCGLTTAVVRSGRRFARAGNASVQATSAA